MPFSGETCALSVKEKGMTGTMTEYMNISTNTANETVMRMKVLEDLSSKQLGLLIAANINRNINYYISYKSRTLVGISMNEGSPLTTFRCRN